MKKQTRSQSILLLLLAVSITTTAQRKPSESSSQKLTTEDYDSSTLTTLKWRSIGPWRGGRCLAVTGVLNDPYTYYMGATWWWHLENYRTVVTVGYPFQILLFILRQLAL
jgi:hypothetical protein